MAPDLLKLAQSATGIKDQTINDSSLHASVVATWLDALPLQSLALEGHISSRNAVSLVQLLQFFVKVLDGME